jgi:hypothetical protein
MHPLVQISRFLERERSGALLLGCAVATGLCFVFATFDVSFLLGGGSFWANPRGPWLMDPADSSDSIDILTTQVAYLGFLHAPWGLPLFYVHDLGAPGGSSVILVDAVPIVALLGKLLMAATGIVINPYGPWVGACFVLAALFATLLVMECGQRSLLAALAASLLAMSMPELLHRFGHLSLMGQFVLMGALWRYLRDARTARWPRFGWWAGWLCLAALLHGYLFAMTAALYAATWLRRLDAPHTPLQAVLAEPALIAGCVALLLVLAGHFGKGTGTTLSGAGYGYYSMNLASPVWPQRSGLFPGFEALMTGPDGQYEGFNYLGAGVLALLLVAVSRFGRALAAAARRHIPLLAMLGCLALFAVSDAVFVGAHQLIYVPLPRPLAEVAGIFRSSGRMFWPCGYVLALLGLAFVLRRLRPGWRTAVVLGCCLMQLADTNPLRVRLTLLTERDVPTLLDRADWQARMALAARVHVVPPFSCSPTLDTAILHLELQRAAMMVARPIDSANNPRQWQDCTSGADAARRGPWDPRTLDVFLTDKAGIPPGWRPPGLACTAFRYGFWCLGADAADR